MTGRENGHRPREPEAAVPLWGGPVPSFKPRRRELSDEAFAQRVESLARESDPELWAVVDLARSPLPELPDVGNDGQEPGPLRATLDDELEQKISDLMDSMEEAARPPLPVNAKRADRVRRNLGPIPPEVRAAARDRLTASLAAVPDVGKPRVRPTKAERELVRLLAANRTSKLVVYPQQRRVLTASGVEVPGGFEVVQKALRGRSQRRRRARSGGPASTSTRSGPGAKGLSGGRRSRP